MTKAKLSKTAEKKPVEDKKSLEPTEAPPPPDAEQEPGASSAEAAPSGEEGAPAEDETPAKGVTLTESGSPAEEAAAPAVQTPVEPAAAAEPDPQPVCTPTSEPLGLCVDDVSDTSITLKWRRPERIGSADLEGYGIEYCKEGTDEWIPAMEGLTERTSTVIKGLTTGDKLQFRVRAYNMAGPSAPATLAQPITIREIMQRPKIWLPRNLRQTLIKKVGDTMNIVIPFQGKPRPKVTWSKDGEPLDPTIASVRNSEVDTIFFIRKTERKHSGKYELQVQIENVEDKAAVTLQVVDLPGPPEALKIVDTWGFNVALEWKPPKDNGNCEITGYTIQKADKKTMVRLSSSINFIIIMLFNQHLNLTWYKNKMDISNEAKYRMISKQGVLTLEIRKPCPFDGGVYTCKAVNDSGEDTVECKLEVRRK
uniref:Myosin binding protein C, cardiac n=1 Tax=Pundamilia nyererei TaxID=303518 RepID=A0A3B4FFE5_9CICH